MIKNETKNNESVKEEKLVELNEMELNNVVGGLTANESGNEDIKGTKGGNLLTSKKYWYFHAVKHILSYKIYRKTNIPKKKVFS